MKALLIGPTASDFDPGYNTGISRALADLGCQTQIMEFFITTPPGLLNRVLIDGGLQVGFGKFYDRYIEDFNRRILDLYQTMRPDIVIVVRGSKVSADILDDISAVKVLWCHDVVRRCDIDQEQLSAYDKRYVFEFTDVAWLDQRGLSAKFLPIGFDPHVYRPLNTPKDIDVFFVGAYYPERRVVLEQLAEHLGQQTLRFYGRHLRYREPATWLKYCSYMASGKGAIFVNRSLDAIKINEMYSRSKVCLNMHHAQNQYGCNPRVFEIMGSGSFQVVDNIPFIKKELGDLISTYSDTSSLLNIIRASLQDEEFRRSRVEAGRELVLDTHTFAHRMKIILSDCNLV